MRAPSLHELSVLEAVQASAARTPAQIAYRDGETALSYGALADRIARGEAHTLGWPRGDAKPAGEFATFAQFGDTTLSHRDGMLQALELAVATRAFSRDTVCLLATSRNTRVDTIALVATWVAGGTIVRSATPAAISACDANVAVFPAAALGDTMLAAAASFRFALIDGAVDPIARGRLDRLFGPTRWRSFE